jgi:hypothetical protein
VGGAGVSAGGSLNRSGAASKVQALTKAPSTGTLEQPMATKKTDPTDRMIAVLERIETELRGLKAEAKETNERLGRLETQGKRTNRRLGNMEVRLTGVEVPAMASIEQRVQRLEAAVFTTAAE